MVTDSPEKRQPGKPPIRFGAVRLTDGTEVFRRQMNQEMLALMRSLPSSRHTEAVVFFMRHLRSPITPEFDFFRSYTAPIWSVLYWLEEMPPADAGLTAEDRRNARTGHAMALFLHLFDDHLHDGQLPATHLSLLLRSQAWLRMQMALEQLAVGVTNGTRIIRGFIDDYYATIESSPPEDTLESYCDHFRRQMATGMNVPVLAASKMGFGDDFIRALQAAYGAVGIAWRLLDDWQDRETDLAAGCHSAIYYCLPAEMRLIWDQKQKRQNAGRDATIRPAVFQDGIRETIKTRIAIELTSAASMLDGIGMTGLADEIRCLARPLKS